MTVTIFANCTKCGLEAIHEDMPYSNDGENPKFVTGDKCKTAGCDGTHQKIMTSYKESKEESGQISFLQCPSCHHWDIPADIKNHKCAIIQKFNMKETVTEMAKAELGNYPIGIMKYSDGESFVIERNYDSRLGYTKYDQAERGSHSCEHFLRTMS